MRSRNLYGFGLVALASALLGASPIDREAVAPRPRSPFDPPTRSQSRKRRERAERAELKAGIPGAGLWRKCRAGGRVRGH